MRKLVGRLYKHGPKIGFKDIQTFDVLMYWVISWKTA